MKVDRRTVLAGGSALLVASAASMQSGGAEAIPSKSTVTRRIFDVHARVMTAPPLKNGRYDVAQDLAVREAVMKDWGIEATVLMAPYVYEQPNGLADTARQNDYIAWYRNNYREKFPVGIGTVEPNQGLEAGLSEIRRAHSKLGLDGIVFHPDYSGSGIGDSRMVRFAKECAQLKMPVLVDVLIPGIHETAAGVEALALAAPEATIVALGSFNTERVRGELIAVAKRCPNVLFETSYYNQMGEVIAMFVDLCGSERVIFGSDMDSEKTTMYLYPQGLIDILESKRLREEDRENILWKNAYRIFGLA